jgi:predicted RNA-binding Zn ribbon-like protein
MIYDGDDEMASMRQVNHNWIPRDIIGGNSALDLVNTVSGWGDDPEDWIPDVGSFLEWTHVSGLLNVHEKSKAVHQVAASPASAERVLASLKELRFALWHLIDSLGHRKRAGLDHLSVLNSWASYLALSQHVVFGNNKIDFALRANVSVLDLPGLRVTVAALSLLMDPPAKRLKTCSGINCGWKFVDKSKNSSRRWCDMAVCGNLCKARHYRLRNN